jgi:repressor LexA
MPGPRGQTRQAILAFILERTREGRPPTVREIQAAFGFRAVQTVQAHLERLVAEGALTREAGKARSVRPAGEAGGRGLAVPVLGRVRAGPLSEAIASPEGSVLVDPTRVGGAEGLFALLVRGDSMVGAGILEGDLVIARQQPGAQPGDIVVARLGDEATVKRFTLRQGRPVLLAENPAYPPILVDAADAFAILGKVVEVRRYMAPG